MAPSRQRLTTPLDWSREGRHPPRPRCRRQRHLGSVGQDARKARLAHRRRHDPPADRRPDRLPLHHRRHHTRRGTRDPHQVRAGQERASPGSPRLPGCSCLHHISRLARLRRGQDEGAPAGDAEQRVPPLQAQGRQRCRAGQAPSEHCARDHRLRQGQRAHGRCEPGLERA